MTTAQFKKTIWNYYHSHGRRLAWRTSRNPYRIVVSEIMLQQTQVDRVAKKYPQFIATFPTFKALAEAPLAAILHAWQGLGYNRRAIALHRLAYIVVTDYHGRLPPDFNVLKTLPGIGPHTAGSIAAFAFNIPTLFIETNIRSVFIHFFFPNVEKVTDQELQPLIEKTLDHANPREWYYALMDYGAFLKKNHPNPSRRSAHHTKQSKFAGSNRELRGQMVKLFTLHSRLSSKKIAAILSQDAALIEKNLTALEREGFIKKR